jgi:myo-inositol-1(or 4)-monophosphatase
MTKDELEHALGVALAAAREAGALLRSGFRKRADLGDVESKGSAVDLVTKWDRASEELLRERLAALPYAMVGEEGGGSYDASAPVLFVDPLDGTTNWVHGHPFWCVSIGLVVGEASLLGVVHAPAVGLEWCGFLAGDGSRSAVRRGLYPAATEEPCVPSANAELGAAMLGTGFPYDRRTNPDNNFAEFVRIKPKVQAVRRCGSAAMDLCLVADGTYDGYWEKKLSPWDIAGGSAIVRAAGGRVTSWDGGASYLAEGRCVATNGRLHDALLAELAAVVRPLPT